jgi:hypothetical protein
MPIKTYSAFPIRIDLLPCSEHSCQQTGLATEEEATATQQAVSCDIAKGAWSQEWGEIRKRLFFATRESDGSWLLDSFEGIEHGNAVVSDAECEVEAKTEPKKAPNGYVG